MQVFRGSFLDNHISRSVAIFEVERSYVTAREKIIRLRAMATGHGCFHNKRLLLMLSKFKEKCSRLQRLLEPFVIGISSI